MSYQHLGYDPTVLVTPYDPDVLDLATYLGSVKACYEWVRDNIAYRPDLDEVWRLPIHTIELGTGDCDDQAILLCSLIRALGEQAVVRVIKMAQGGHAVVFWRGGMLDPTQKACAFDEEPHIPPYLLVADFNDFRLDVYEPEIYENIIVALS